MSQEAPTTKLSDYLVKQIPQNNICLSALALAREALQGPIFNHSLRVFLIAKFLSDKEGTPYAEENQESLLFVSAICHDLGTSDSYNGSQRFEVEGADAAKAHLTSHGVTPEESQKAWVAIALHTSPGIAERIDPFTRLLRVAVKADFSQDVARELGVGDYSREIEEHLPRLDAERCLADAVVKQAIEPPEKVDHLTWHNSQKHPKASWPGILLRAHLENPDHGGVNPAF
ncbi:Fc.00g084580.m01.CDS01 [Cosmosporella sp. VM-42]